MLRDTAPRSRAPRGRTPKRLVGEGRGGEGAGLARVVLGLVGDMRAGRVRKAPPTLPKPVLASAGGSRPEATSVMERETGPVKGPSLPKTTRPGGDRFSLASREQV